MLSDSLTVLCDPTTHPNCSSHTYNCPNTELQEYRASSPTPPVYTCSIQGLWINRMEELYTKIWEPEIGGEISSVLTDSSSQQGRNTDSKILFFNFYFLYCHFLFTFSFSHILFYYMLINYSTGCLFCLFILLFLIILHICNSVQ
jgi:hypothetical protein